MNAASLASTVLVLALVASACGKSKAPAASPTVAATSSPAPSATATGSATQPTPQSTPTQPAPPASTPPGKGTIVVYSYRTLAGTAIVHAFDASLGRDVQSFSFGGANDSPVAVVLAGADAVTATDHEIAWQRLDGSDRRVIATIPQQETLRDIAVSHNGATLAITTGDEGGKDGALTFLDIASGKTLSVLPRTDPRLSAFGGYFFYLGWLDDDSGVLVRDGVGKDGWPNSATVLLDGSVTVRLMDTFQSYAPGMRRVAITHDLVGGLCALGHQVVLSDVATATATNTLSDPTRALLPVEWAPDGSSVLVAGWAGDGPCDASPTTPAYTLLPIDGGSTQPIHDVAALRKSWGGVHEVSLECHETQFGGGLAADAQFMLNGTIYLDCGSSTPGFIPSLKFGETTIGPVPEAAPVYVLGVN